jgi:predicted DNA-binding protein (UPF0251 family)
MGRPTKWRRVSFIPEATFFTPVGVLPRSLREVRLSVEEAEAIRLRDLEGLEQEECALRMRVSRPTFHRVLEDARKKVADAVLNGKALRIEGGKFELATRRFRCARDGHEWDVPFEALIANSPLACPNCNSHNIQPLPPLGFGRGRRHRGWSG